MLLNLISIKVVIGRFLKEYNIDDTNYVDDLPQWTRDAIEIIGIPNYFIPKHTIKKIESNRCSLPCDIENLYGIWVTNSTDRAQTITELGKLEIRNNPLIGAGIKRETPERFMYGNISGNFLNTSFSSGYVYIAYKGLPTDCDGYPMVPKDTKLNNALQYYFIWRMALSGYTHPVISPKDALALWEKNYPAAANSVNWMDISELQEFTNMWTNPILGDLHTNNYIV
jgi:hypothetical protein